MVHVSRCHLGSQSLMSEDRTYGALQHSLGGGIGLLVTGCKRTCISNRSENQNSQNLLQLGCDVRRVCSKADDLVEIHSRRVVCDRWNIQRSEFKYLFGGPLYRRLLLGVGR